MNELSFPVIGAMVVFFVAVPLLTVLSRGLIAMLPRWRDRLLAQVSAWQFLLIVGPSLGPVIWLLSAAMHQSEQSAPLAACIVEHGSGDVCRDLMLFAWLLFSVLGVGTLRRARGRDLPAAATGGRPVAAEQRLHRICEAHPILAALADRVCVVGRGLSPVCTRGWLRPRIELEAALMDRLSDDELMATLLHESEHTRGCDPLRFFVAEVALSVNPLRGLLTPEWSRYRFTREALCDRRAVQRGADPLALARSIVSVATPASSPGLLLDPRANLGGPGIGGVRVRVQLLLSYAARGPGPVGQHAPFGLATAAVIALCAMPHFIGTGALDMLHRGIEQAVLPLASVEHP